MATWVAALIDIAIRIGKAIVRKLARMAAKAVVRWMRKRVIVFKERWERARVEGNERRMAWLLGRIERWTHAADWIEANALAKLREAAQAACADGVFAGLPERASCEKWTAQ